MSQSGNGAAGRTLDRVLLAHGDGGRLAWDLIRGLFQRHLADDELTKGGDAALLDVLGGRLAFTTDSFVVSPLFFPGGDIGKLAVCGTVNDLAVSGAKPQWLSVGFIIEEGLPLSTLENIAASIAAAASDAGVRVVAADTKVVERHKADGLYINTSGVGVVPSGRRCGPEFVLPGDALVVTGPVGDHGIAIMTSRAGLEFDTPVTSDCAALAAMLERAWELGDGVRMMRDPTRGGLATTLKEMAVAAGCDFIVDEGKIPIHRSTRAACDLLGLDPLYLANEGKAVVIVAADQAHRLVAELRRFPQGRGAAVIGQAVMGTGEVRLRTAAGGTRLLELLSCQPLPRIC